MSAPLSPDLRRRILAALDAGEGSQRQIAQRFRVGRATVERLVRRVRETGSMDPKPHGGGQRPRLVETDREQILAWLEAEPDLRQEDIAERFEQMEHPMSQQAVSRGLRRLGITRKKKTLRPQQQLSETFQAERATFQDELARIDPSRTKVVDESRVEVGMRLPYGYSLRGTRCTDIAPYRTAQYCARTKQKLIGWLSLDGSGVVARCVRTVTGCLFRGFVRQHLACHLCPGDVVVWDNARIHGVEGI